MVLSPRPNLRFFPNFYYDEAHEEVQNNPIRSEVNENSLISMFEFCYSDDEFCTYDPVTYICVYKLNLQRRFYRV